MPWGFHAQSMLDGCAKLTGHTKTNHNTGCHANTNPPAATHTHENTNASEKGGAGTNTTRTTNTHAGANHGTKQSTQNTKSDVGRVRLMETPGCRAAWPRGRKAMQGRKFRWVGWSMVQEPLLGQAAGRDEVPTGFHFAGMGP